MAEAASNASGEGEAEAMVGAAVVTVLSPRDRRALSALLPDLLRGTAVLTRILRRHPRTRALVKTVPGIMRRSVRQLSGASTAAPTLRGRAHGPRACAAWAAFRRADFRRVSARQAPLESAPRESVRHAGGCAPAGAWLLLVLSPRLARHGWARLSPPECRGAGSRARCAWVRIGGGIPNQRDFEFNLLDGRRLAGDGKALFARLA